MASRRLFDGAQIEIGSLPIVAASAPPTNTIVWLRVGGVWKQATVWLRVGGVWKTTTPFVRVSGVWK